jgi:hypothetical protein
MAASGTPRVGDSTVARGEPDVHLAGHPETSTTREPPKQEVQLVDQIPSGERDRKHGSDAPDGPRRRVERAQNDLDERVIVEVRERLSRFAVDVECTSRRRVEDGAGCDAVGDSSHPSPFYVVLPWPAQACDARCVFSNYSKHDGARARPL